MQRQKYLCLECGWAAKAPCPQHPGQSTGMGTQWRPGKKGTRYRLWDERVAHSARRHEVRIIRANGRVHRENVHDMAAGRKPDAIIELNGRSRSYSGGQWPDCIRDGIRLRHLKGKGQSDIPDYGKLKFRPAARPIR